MRAVVIEVQLGVDTDKQFVWPAYLAGMRLRHRCRTTLLAVAIRSPIAAWCARPMELGDGHAPFQPVVIGPAMIERVIDAQQARAMPGLALLSVAAHGQSEDATEIGQAALAAGAALDGWVAGMYTDMVYFFLGKQPHSALEQHMHHILDTWVWQSPVAKKYVGIGIERGIKKGRKEGERAMLTRQLIRLFGALPEDVTTRIERARPAQLERWSERVLDARSLDEVFAPARRAASPKRPPARRRAGTSAGELGSKSAASSASKSARSSNRRSATRSTRAKK